MDATMKIRVLTDQDFMVHVRKNELCWDEQRWLTLVGRFVYNSSEARLLFFFRPYLGQRSDLTKNS